MNKALYWFRCDLRLSDHPALARACADADELTFVYVRRADEVAPTRWGFPRLSPPRRRFRDQAIAGLAEAIAAKGGGLVQLDGAPVDCLTDLAQRTGATRVYCEEIAAPEERSELAALRAAGLEVHATWQSTLIDPLDLPFVVAELPEVFTAFRHAVEKAHVTPRAPILPPRHFPAGSALARPSPSTVAASPPANPSHLSSFPLDDAAFHGSEAAALAHAARYFESALPATYKATRNGLTGTAYSTKLSPWLAVGALSPRSVYAALKHHEAVFGSSDGSYWIWFELLWRDFFRFWSEKHGVRLFSAAGISTRGVPSHDEAAFRRWCEGTTGHPFVDAGMRELATTGYLSNRLRQVVASYLVYDLACDWRAGAAWFESRLIDYDVCSNQGNWLYIAGRGADPRQGRRFDPDQQAAAYDKDGAYRALWSTLGEGASR
jgi:deoxyribodipyrimidine photo-lyase